MATKTLYARSLIKLGGDKGDVEPGDKLPAGVDTDTVKHWLQKGLVTTYDPTKTPEEQLESASETEAENESLRAKVADLEARLAASSQGQGSNPSK